MLRVSQDLSSFEFTSNSVSFDEQIGGITENFDGRSANFMKGETVRH
jgi:hypothetical protein